MEERLNIEQQMIQYLLGDLSIQDRYELETEYFTNPEIFDLLQSVELDLVEGYVTGKLSATGRLRFEQNYLTTRGRREQVQFFKTLSANLPLDTKQPKKEPLPAVGFEAIKPVAPVELKPSFWELLLAPFRGPKLALGVSLAIAVLLITLVGSLRFIERRNETTVAQNSPQPQQKIEDKQEPPASPANPIPETPSPKTRPTVSPKATPAVISLTWTITGLRVLGATTPRLIRIPPGHETVQITLNFLDLAHDRYSRFNAVVQNSTGKEVWRRSDLKANRAKAGSAITLNIPAKQLKPGPYSLMLSGNKHGEWVDIREFYIKVVR
ncbi:MAG: hypothetical protein J2P31_06660 [Blastocatellia bacterium]|nr:hypothetical protein [Blastocatellia bacterium]